MKNKIKHKIISYIKCAAKRLLIGPAVVVYARPTHRDIHLHSSQAISIWLAMLDRSPHDAEHQKEEFERAYAAKSNLSVAQLHVLDQHAAPCDCGQDDCKGWQMVTQTDGVGTSPKELE